MSTTLPQPIAMDISNSSPFKNIINNANLSDHPKTLCERGGVPENLLNKKGYIESPTTSGIKNHATISEIYGNP